MQNREKSIRSLEACGGRAGVTSLECIVRRIGKAIQLSRVSVITSVLGVGVKMVNIIPRGWGPHERRYSTQLAQRSLPTISQPQSL